MLFSALLLASPGALAATDPDVTACEGASEGDACTRENGDEATCLPDESDPGTLKCDDDGGSSSGSGCSTTGPLGASALGLLALGLLARRR
jgi:uncharacterized protein (TIGR03382 family)